MTTSLPRALMRGDGVEQIGPLRLDYGTATGTNEVAGVPMKALSPVVDGDWTSFLAAGGDRLILGRVGSTEWTPVTFTNSWVNFGSGQQDAQYQRAGDRVHLRGCIKSGTMVASAFTLPAGFRPPVQVPFAVDSNGTFGVVRVHPSGAVVPVIGTNDAVHLNGVSFSVTP